MNDNERDEILQAEHPEKILSYVNLLNNHWDDEVQYNQNVLMVRADDYHQHADDRWGHEVQ